MTIDAKRHPLGQIVEVYLDGELLRNCPWADDERGEAAETLVDDETNGEIRSVIRRGKVEFRALPGYEDRLRWFQVGFFYGRSVGECVQMNRMLERGWGNEKVAVPDPDEAVSLP